MAKVQAGRYTADLFGAEDEFVVFLIGMRVNKPWRLAQWWPVLTAMPRMLRYLETRPEKGLLGYRLGMTPSPTVVQYWRSFGDLERFARDRDDPHLEPWRRFNRMVGASGDVGVWHETYRVRASDCETIYVNMPPTGLARAFTSEPIRRGRDSAGARIGARSTDEPVVPVP